MQFGLLSDWSFLLLIPFFKNLIFFDKGLTVETFLLCVCVKNKNEFEMSLGAGTNQIGHRRRVPVEQFNVIKLNM